MEIRQLTYEDLDWVEKIEISNFTLPWSKGSFLSSMEQDNTIYLAAMEGRKGIGYCGLLKVLDEGEITNVSVDQKYQGKGTGYLMLLELIRQASLKGVTTFHLEVRKSNTRALSLYKRLGFWQVGVRKDFYEKPREDGILMRMDRI